MRDLATAQFRAALAVAVAVAVASLAVAPVALGATTYTVTGTADTSPTPTCTGTVCPTLRAAVNAADADPGSIVQLAAATYDLSQSAIIISPTSGSMTIAGAGDAGGGTTIEQTHAGDRVVRISATEPVTLSGLALTGGTLTGTNGSPGAVGGDAFGGGIENLGATLTLDHVAVTDNTASGGNGGNGNAANVSGGGGGNAAGGIYSTGQLTLASVLVSGNHATAGDAGNGYAGSASGNGGSGGSAVGAIDEQSPTGPTSIANSTISSNGAVGGAAGDKGGGCCAGLGGSAVAGIEHTAEDLTLNATTVTENTATGGPGINSAPTSFGGNASGGLSTSTPSGGTLTITAGTFSANTARGGPGGTGGFALGAGLDIGGMTATIASSTIAGNHTTGGASGGGNPGSLGGGGVFVESGASLAVTNTTIAGNVVSGGGNTNNHDGQSGCGAGLSSEGGTTLVSDTIANNSVDGGPSPTGGNGGSASGAGLCLYVSGTTVVLNSTITGNLAQGGGTTTNGGDADGGGIELQAGSAELANDTVANNSVSPGAGGSAEAGNLMVDDNPPVGTMTLADTIISGGTVTGGGGNANCSVTAPYLVDKGGNLESTTPSQCGLGAGNLVGVDPRLGALADNGGPTQTMALGAGSPAIGAGGACVDPTQPGSPALRTDQRGLPRTIPCDIGAFQSQKPAIKTAPAIGGSAALGKTLSCSAGTWTGDVPLTYSYQWSRAGAAISGARSSTYKVGTADIGHALTCAVTASNEYGSATAGSASVAIPPKPSISKLSQSHRRWRASSKQAKLSRSHNPKTPTGTTFSFKLNTSASLKLQFFKCAVSHRKTRCTHSAGSLTFSNVRAGSRKISFAGALSKHSKLKPDRYELTIQATNSSGKQTSKALQFTIV